MGPPTVIAAVEGSKTSEIFSLKIFNGQDPRETEKSELLELQLGEVIRKYYAEELTTVNQYRPSTIKGIKAVFGPWIFRKTYEKDILNRLERVEDIQYKKLSFLTPKMAKELFQVCGSRSPYVANRLLEYLRKFWNDFVKIADNPFLLKKKYKYSEKVYEDYLSPVELKRVMKNLVRRDERSGRLLYSYYKQWSLSPVSCLLLASS